MLVWGGDVGTHRHTHTWAFGTRDVVCSFLRWEGFIDNSNSNDTWRLLEHGDGLMHILGFLLLLGSGVGLIWLRFWSDGDRYPDYFTLLYFCCMHVFLDGGSCDVVMHVDDTSCDICRVCHWDSDSVISVVDEVKPRSEVRVKLPMQLIKSEYWLCKCC